MTPPDLSSRDDELGAAKIFRLDPRAAVIRPIGPIGALRDDPLKAVLAGGATERFAVTGLVVIEHHAGRRSLEDDRQSPLAIEQR